MTTAQATNLQTKWKQQCDPPPLCEHPIQELVRLSRSDMGYLVGTYRCRECEEAIVYTHPPSPLVNTPPLD